MTKTATKTAGGVGAPVRRASVNAAERLYEKYLPKIQKRDGRIVPFQFDKVVTAVTKAMTATGEGSADEASLVAHKVASEMMQIARKYKNFLPNVEACQDEVEKQLILSDYVTTAKAYILYRAERARQRKEHGTVPEHVRKLAEESKKYFKNNPLGEFVYLRTYAKWIEGEQRRETWIETVDRYVNFMKKNLGDKLTAKEYDTVHRAILNQEVMPSMRAMQFAGPAAERCNTCFYNCSFIAPTQLGDFAEIMYLSMRGCGVGYSVEHQNIEQLPQIQKQSGQKMPTHVVADTAEGWGDALTLGLKTWYSGKDITFDFSKLRPAGARLKTMGGKSSGPDPLISLLGFAREKIFARQGRRLRTIDAHDIICKIGECVVAGGVRRSAMISLSDLDDELLRDAKKGQFYLTDPHRSIANNSAVYEVKPTNEEFMDEWVSLMKAKTGERGIFNRAALEKTMPKRRLDYLKKKYEGKLPQMGTNPCVTADTWVTTDEGARQAADLVGKPFTAIVNGAAFGSDGFFKTGEKPVFEIKTDRGFIFRATDNHKVLTVDYKSRKVQRNVWKTVGELTQGDQVVLHRHSDLSWGGSGTETEGWLLGSLLGDGNIEKDGKANLDYWGEHRSTMMAYAVSAVHTAVGGRSNLKGHMAKTGYARVGSANLGVLAKGRGMVHGQKIVTDQVESSSSEFYEGFLRGWFDADGSVQGTHEKGMSVRLTSVSLPCLVRAQRMLARLGIISNIYESRREAGMRTLPDGRGGSKEYACKAQHELVIANDNVQVFAQRVNFTDPSKSLKLKNLLQGYRRTPNRERFSATVASITAQGIEAVYDCTVPGPHAFDGNGIILHNCGEITLQSKQFCNLSEVIARSNDTEATLTRKAKIAALLGTYQSTLTTFGYLSKEWTENCKAERLLGVSVTGQWDCTAFRNPKTMKKMRSAAVSENQKYAKRFGINASMSVTCVKPSGTISKTFDNSSGMHPRFAPYYIQRIRISSTDSLFKMLKDQGVPFHPEVGQTAENANTYVLEFPVKAPKGSVYKDDITALEQLEYWKMVKLNFTEHNPSVTVSVSNDEWIAVANWLYDNWDILGGLSFLPRSDHAYRLAPMEPCSKETYERLMQRMEHIDYSKIVTYEKKDETEQKKELACAGGVCEIV